MNVEPEICPVCGRMPCHGISMGPGYLTAAYEYRATTGNGNASVRFYLCKINIREVCDVLGQGVRVQIPDFMEKFIKLSFPNENWACYVGLAEADEHE